jgi:hypothetical protein
MRHPNNKHGKPRRRNDGTLVKYTVDPRSLQRLYPFIGPKGRLLRLHRDLIKNSLHNWGRAFMGRYVWNPGVRRAMQQIAETPAMTGVEKVEQQLAEQTLDVQRQAETPAPYLAYPENT